MGGLVFSFPGLTRGVLDVDAGAGAGDRRVGRPVFGETKAGAEKRGAGAGAAVRARRNGGLDVDVDARLASAGV